MSLVFKPRILMVNLSGASRERVKPMTISLHHTTSKLNLKKRVQTVIRNKNTPTGLASFPGISISHHYVAEYQGSRA